MYNFIVPPKITPFSFARDLNVGDRTSIQCVVVTGDLPLMFTWLKDNQPILTGSSSLKSNLITDSHSANTMKHSGSGTTVAVSEDEKDNGITNDGRIIIRQNDEFTSALSITKVSRAQSGTYTCRVQNDAAVVTHSAQLRVNGILGSSQSFFKLACIEVPTLYL